MPQRSNDFQQLVLTIERQLAPNARITESLLVIDRDGVEREIDIAIETKIGNHEVRIAIECRDRARRCDVTWIDQVKGKFANLPGWQPVVVSKGGFTKNARQKAALNGITTLTLEAASHRDWSRPVRDLTSMRFESIRHYADGPCTVICKDGFGPLVIEPPPAEQKIRFIDDARRHVTLQRVIDSLANNPDERPKFDAALADPETQRMAMTLRCDHWNLRVIDESGVEHPIEQLYVLIRRERLVGEAVFHQVDYGESAVAYGETTVGDFRFRATKALGRDGKVDPSISVLIDPPPGWTIGVDEQSGGSRLVAHQPDDPE